MAERRPVTREEYEAEVAELGRLKAEYENKWTSLRRIVASIRRWERIIASLEARFAELRRIGWTRLRAPERREYLAIRDVRLPRARAFWLGWDTERTKIIAEIKREREEIRSLEAEIARKIVVVIQFIGTEAKTGYSIFIDLETRKYRVMHPKTKELIRTEDKIVIEYTGSIETGVRRAGAREFIAVEITAITGVHEMDSAQIAIVEKEIDERVTAYMVEAGWGATITAFRKKGVAYNGLSIVKAQNHYGYPVPQYRRLAIHVEKTKKSIRPKDYGWVEVEISKS